MNAFAIGKWFFETGRLQLPTGTQCILKDKSSINTIFDGYWNYVDTTTNLETSQLIGFDSDVKIVSLILVILYYIFYAGISLKYLLFTMPKIGNFLKTIK